MRNATFHSRRPTLPRVCATCGLTAVTGQGPTAKCAAHLRESMGLPPVK